MRMVFRQRSNLGEILKGHADAKRGADVVVAHGVKDRRQIVGKLGEIQVAVRINQHVGQAARREGLTMAA